MHATAVLQKLIRRSIPSIHFKRVVAVTAIVGSALCGGRLTLSALGRNLDTPCAVRHRIKRVDRLLGNPHLHIERLLFYRCLCDQLIGDRREPVLIVDWSDLKPDRRFLLLRVSVWVHGFALPIFEEIHPLRRQYARRVQREFLLTLRMLLPEDCRPVIVTDAGFRSPWFQEVERLGWHWLGRIRNRTMIEVAPRRWVHCKTLYPQASATPRDLGTLRLTRANPVTARLCLYYRPRRRGPKRPFRCPRNGREKYPAREREPWLIAASPSLSDKTALDLINLYRIRMRIEHSFRTLKSHQFGFALEDSQSRTSNRVAVLLVIHALAMFLAWIAGWAAQRTGLQHQLKSNADRRQTGLSIISLGLMALTMLHLQLSAHDFTLALQTSPPLTPPNRESRK